VGRRQGGHQRLHADVLEAAPGIDLQAGKGYAEVGAAAVQQLQGFLLRGAEQGDVQQGWRSPRLAMAASSGR
jgi:hypothetical protein